MEHKDSGYLSPHSLSTHVSHLESTYKYQVFLIPFHLRDDIVLTYQIHRRNHLKIVKMAAAATQQMFSIPKKYKACVYDKPGTISTKIEELDTPEPGPGDVLVRL